MANIEVLEPISSASGVFYCAGFVNGTYTHFLSYGKLTKKEIKQKLLDKYNNDHGFEFVERGE